MFLIKNVIVLRRCVWITKKDTQAQTAHTHTPILMSELFWYEVRSSWQKPYGLAKEICIMNGPYHLIKSVQLYLSSCDILISSRWSSIHAAPCTNCTQTHETVPIPLPACSCARVHVCVCVCVCDRESLWAGGRWLYTAHVNETCYTHMKETCYTHICGCVTKKKCQHTDVSNMKKKDSSK